LHVLPRFIDVLAGQRVHQIDVYALKQQQRFVDGAAGFVALMDAAERLEFGVIETLHADGKAVDAGIAETAEFLALKGTGIGLQRDLRPRGAPQRLFHPPFGYQAMIA